MIKSADIETSIERVVSELRALAYAGMKGSITAHCDGRRFTKIERIDSQGVTVIFGASDKVILEPSPCK